MATWTLSGAHILVSQKVKLAHGNGVSMHRNLRHGSREAECRKLVSAGQSLFLGRQELKVNLGYVAPGQNHSRQQLRVAYTTTEKIAGSRLRPKEPGKRRLILLRHAKSSWSDKTLRGVYLEFFPSSLQLLRSRLDLNDGWLKAKAKPGYHGLTPSLSRPRSEQCLDG
jgi:hypothetical protein